MLWHAVVQLISFTDLLTLCSRYALIIQLMRRAFSLCAHTHTESRMWHLNEDINTNKISRTALRVTSWTFHWSKTILISYTHRNVKVFTATRQNKSHFFLNKIQSLLLSHHHSTCALVSEVGYEVGYETLLRTLQQKYLFSRMYILLLL